MNDSNDQKHALLVQALGRFRRSQRPGAWLYLEKEQLIEEIADTIEKPSLVYQERATLSGVAAIVYELARREPQRYARICQELYESGAFTYNGRLLEPSPQLRKSYPPAAMRDVDWLLMATLRNIEVTLFPNVKSEIPLTVSQPAAMSGWVKALLGLPKASFVSTLVFGAFEALEQAIQVIKQGGVVFMLVDVGLFGSEKRPLFRQGFHWLTFLGETGLAQPDIKIFTFFCHSWGRRYELELDRATFEENALSVLWAI